MRADLKRTPERVFVGRSKEIYERIDDPGTGTFLGGYAWVDPDATLVVWDSPQNGFSIGQARP
jgi:hypothetical protein